MLIQAVQGKPQELMLVLPGHLSLSESLALRRRWRWIRDLGDEICRRRLGNPVHEHADVGDFQDDREAECKTKEDPFTVEEPPPFLFLVEPDTAEVRLELIDMRIDSYLDRESEGKTYQLSHQTAGRKVALQEGNKDPLGEHHPGPKYNGSRNGPDSVVEGIENDCGHDEPADNRNQGEQVRSYPHRDFAGVSMQKRHDGLRQRLGRAGATLGRVHGKVRVVHFP